MLDWYLRQTPDGWQWFVVKKGGHYLVGESNISFKSDDQIIKTGVVLFTDPEAQFPYSARGKARREAARVMGYE